MLNAADSRNPVARYDAILSDIDTRYAAGDCTTIQNPTISIDPPTAVNFLQPKQGGGFDYSEHELMVSLKRGAQPVASTPVSVSLSGGGQIWNGTTWVTGPLTVATDAAGQAKVKIHNDTVGTSSIKASATMLLPTGSGVSLAANKQKLVLSGNTQFTVTAAATKEWVAGGKIVVQKFHDINQNGTQETGEPLIDWNVCLTEGLTCDTGYVALGTSGTKAFDVASEKSYTICEKSLAAWTQTTPANRCVTGLKAGDNILFGNYQQRGLLVKKYHDLNGDGQRGQNEPSLDGWGFDVFQRIGDVWSFKLGGYTANGGVVGFTGLVAALYKAEETLQSNWLNSTPLTQTADLTGANMQATLVFGNLQPGSLIVNKSWDGASAPLGGAELCIQRTGPGTPITNLVPKAGAQDLVQKGDSYCYTGLVDSVTITNLWPGDYAVTETSLTGWAGIVTPSTVSVVSGAAAPTVNMYNTRDTGSLKILKTLSNPDGANVPASFTVNYDCGIGYTGSRAIAPNSPATISDIPTGSTCTVTEVAPDAIPGYTWGATTYTPASVVIASTADTAEITVANSITQAPAPGKITVTKQVAQTQKQDWTFMFTLNDADARWATKASPSVSWINLEPNREYVVAENDPGIDWAEGSFACTVNGTAVGEQLPSLAIKLMVKPGDDVICTKLNTSLGGTTNLDPSLDPGSFRSVLYLPVIQK